MDAFRASIVGSDDVWKHERRAEATMRNGCELDGERRIKGRVECCKADRKTAIVWGFLFFSASFF